MIESMQEIATRFDAIKDHTPKATKKLNELGELLSSAYRIDPASADRMWRYLTDLNVSENPGNAKFYIAQIFNKIVGISSNKDAALLISMDASRVEQLASNGYGGWQFFDCLDALLTGLIEADLTDMALNAATAHMTKYAGDSKREADCYRTIRLIASICGKFLAREEHAETATAVLDGAEASCSPDGATLMRLVVQSELPDSDLDPNAKLFIARACKDSKEFFELLWELRGSISEEDILEQWESYVSECPEGGILPYGDLHDDFSEGYQGSKRQFYIDLIKSNRILLDRYFATEKIRDFECSIIETWIFEGCWDDFACYVGMALTSAGGQAPSRLMHVLHEFADACFFDWGRDTKSGGRSMREAMEGSREQFADALAVITSGLVGCSCYEEFSTFVGQFLIKLDGDTRRLGDLGISDPTEGKIALGRLEEYALAFLRSGEENVPRREPKYMLLIEALCDETSSLTSSLVHGFEKPKELQDRYELANNEIIVELIFKHCPWEDCFRANLISSCIRNGDINRAIELVDMMPTHEKTENKNNHIDEWSYQSMRTMQELILRYDYSKRDDYMTAGITDEMREVVAGLVRRILPRFPEKSRDLLKADLFRIEPNQDREKDEYVDRLMQDVVEYTTFPYSPKTRRKVNSLSMSIIQGLNRLADMGRADVISFILSRLESVKGQLIGVQFSTWLSFIRGAAQKIEPSLLVDAHPYLADVVIDESNKFHLERLAQDLPIEKREAFCQRVLERRGLSINPDPDDEEFC